MPVNRLKQHLLSILIRDVLDHYGSTQVIPICNALQVQVEVRLNRLLANWVRVPLQLRLVLVENVLSLVLLSVAEWTLEITSLSLASEDARGIDGQRLVERLHKLIVLFFVGHIGLADLQLAGDWLETLPIRAVLELFIRLIWLRSIGTQRSIQIFNFVGLMRHLLEESIVLIGRYSCLDLII